MGWWKIDSVETGGISEELPSGHLGDEAPCNAVPGRDEPFDRYNGDGPADILGDALKRVDRLYRTAWKRHASPDEMQAAFNFVFNGWYKRVHVPPSVGAT